MKNILLITQGFPPGNTPESIQSLKFAKYVAKEYETNLHVLAQEFGKTSAYYDSNLYQYLENCNIVIHSAPNLMKFLPKNKIFTKIFFKVLLFLGLPTVDMLWYPMAIRKAKKLIAETDFDLIYTRACGHVSNVIGLKLKKITGKPWIAHFSDPWFDNPILNLNLFQKHITKKLEQEIINKADRIIFVNEEMKKIIMDKYHSDLINKIRVIPHAIDFEELKIYSVNSFSKKDENFIITHAGSFYKKFRTPYLLLKAIDELISEKKINKKNIELRFLGPSKKELEADLKRIDFETTQIKNFGFLSRKETLSLCSQSDVFILIDANINGRSCFLPSKIFDYLLFDIPIIGVTPLGSPSQLVLDYFGFDVCNPVDIESLKQMIMKYYCSNRNSGRFTNDQMRKSKFAIEELGEKLLGVFNEVL